MVAGISAVGIVINSLVVNGLLAVLAVAISVYQLLVGSSQYYISIGYRVYRKYGNMPNQINSDSSFSSTLRGPIRAELDCTVCLFGDQYVCLFKKASSIQV